MNFYKRLFEFNFRIVKVAVYMTYKNELFDLIGLQTLA